MTKPAIAAPAIAALGVTVRFGGVTALSDMSFAVPAESIVGLIGPNGAGKSTLFGVLSGFINPQMGSVAMAGEDVTAISPQARSRRGLRRTFQHPELFPMLTVRDHLVLAFRTQHSRARIWSDLVGAPSRWRRNQAEDHRVDELLGLLGLKQVGARRIAGLPLGILRRVEVGRALAGDPTVVLLDEPSSGLDVRETAQLANVIRRARNERGTGLALVEHDVDLVLGICDVVTVLDFGRQIAEGPPTEIRVNPVVQAAYIGEDLPA